VANSCVRDLDLFLLYRPLVTPTNRDETTWTATPPPTPHCPAVEQITGSSVTYGPRVSCCAERDSPPAFLVFSESLWFIKNRLYALCAAEGHRGGVLSGDVARTYA
jgi:hypothetical protein